MFQVFDSFEDMQAALADATAEANSRLNNAQKALRDDFENTRYWFQPTEYGFPIFGVAYSLAESRALDIAAGASVEEADECAERERVNRMRGYIFSRAFSIACPDGELGDSHAAVLCPIDEIVFELARDAGWIDDERGAAESSRDAARLLRRELVAAVQKMIGGE
jgi:hypothetical protein